MNQKVSIIIPCYKQANFLSETLESVVSQTYTNWECIIVDDGSPDNTCSIAQKFCNIDKRFIYLRKKNGGLSSARNAGINIASGDFIQFLDSDDIILPNKLRNSINFFEDYDFVYCNFEFCDEHDSSQRWQSLIRSKINSFAKASMIINWGITFSIPIHSFLYSKQLFEKKEIRFDESLPSVEDWDFHINIIRCSSKWRYINSTDCLYRINRNGLSQDKTKGVVGTELVIIKYFRKHMSTFFVLKKSQQISEHLLNTIRLKPNDIFFYFRTCPKGENYHLLLISALLISPLFLPFYLLVMLKRKILIILKSRNL